MPLFNWRKRKERTNVEAKTNNTSVEPSSSSSTVQAASKGLGENGAASKQTNVSKSEDVFCVVVDTVSIKTGTFGEVVYGKR